MSKKKVLKKSYKNTENNNYRKELEKKVKCNKIYLKIFYINLYLTFDFE